ncbi:MAG: enoyl-CoA hydratase/isomerase family protein [Acidobacteria bacterium]|nr:enoyl-CoA hydratase/isomerase family protein [Acidobacteriota bacterium]
MSSSLRFHREQEAVRIELASPDGLPRLSASLLEQLDAELARLLADPTCHGIVIHGSEKCFAAGAEIAEVAALGGVTALAFARRGQFLFDRLAGAGKPAVAAVSGYCLGGGFDLALASQWRVATPDAIFGHPGPTLGLLTGWGGTQRLAALIGQGRALELLLASDPVPADRALALGLVDELVPQEQLLPRALKRARQLAHTQT